MNYRLLVTAAALALSPTWAVAQQGNDGVIVTGQRGLDLQTSASRLGLTNAETPAIVDIVTQEDLQQQGARTAIEALNAAPGVRAGNIPGSPAAVSMRGFYRAINYLYDGVRQANSDAGMRNFDSWSFERIEVIKGPASVTSGEGALAGAINFVPRRPMLGQTLGEVFASYGSEETGRVAGDFNTPLGDKAAVRADLSYSRSAGWVNDTDSHTVAGTLALLVKPTDKLTINVSADRFEDKYSTAYYGTPVVSRAAARDPSSVVSGSAGLVLDKAMRKVNFDTTDGVMDSHTTWLRSRTEYKLTDNWTIVNDATWYDSGRLWQDADTYGFNAATGLIDRATTLITHDHQYWSDRLHAAFDGDLAGHRNRLTAGVQFDGTDFFTKRRFGNATSVNPFNPVRGVFPTADNAATFGTRQDVTANVDAHAFFLEDAFNLTRDFLLVGGVRFDKFSLDRRVLNATSGPVSTYGQNYDPVTWRVGAVYSVQPKTQLFAQYTEAATPVSGLFFLSATNATFKVTTGASYEAGVKSSLLDGRVQFTGSLFHIRQDDILTRDPVNPALTIQGGSQTSHGAELSLSWTPTDEWRVELGASLLNAEFDKLIEAGGVNRSGNRPPNTPEQTADLVVTYAPQALPLEFTGIVRDNGDFFTANDNTVKVQGFTTLDASIAWKAPFGKLTLRGRNLTDEFYADWSGYSSGLVFVGEPRSFELSYSKAF